MWHMHVGFGGMWHMHVGFGAMWHMQVGFGGMWHIHCIVVPACLLPAYMCAFIYPVFVHEGTGDMGCIPEHLLMMMTMIMMHRNMGAFHACRWCACTCSMHTLMGPPTTHTHTCAQPHTCMHTETSMHACVRTFHTHARTHRCWNVGMCVYICVCVSAHCRIWHYTT